MVDDAAPMDDLHDHPDFDIHVTRQGGRVQVVVWCGYSAHDTNCGRYTPLHLTKHPAHENPRRDHVGWGFLVPLRETADKKSETVARYKDPVRTPKENQFADSRSVLTVEGALVRNSPGMRCVNGP